MDAHNKELQDTLQRHDEGRNRQAEALRQKLAERRRKKEHELLNKHTDEVRLSDIDKASNWNSFRQSADPVNDTNRISSKVTQGCKC